MTSTNNTSQVHKNCTCGHDPYQLLGKYDVICGRDARAFRNIGNRRFHVTVSMLLQKYKDTEKRKEKSLLVKQTIETVENCGGRFLFLKDGKWEDLEKKRIQEKVGHCFRDMVMGQQKSKSLNQDTVTLADSSRKVRHMFFPRGLIKKTDAGTTPVDQSNTGGPSDDKLASPSDSVASTKKNDAVTPAMDQLKDSSSKVKPASSSIERTPVHRLIEFPSKAKPASSSNALEFANKEVVGKPADQLKKASTKVKPAPSSNSVEITKKKVEKMPGHRLMKLPSKVKLAPSSNSLEITKKKVERTPEHRLIKVSSKVKPASTSNFLLITNKEIAGTEVDQLKIGSTGVKPTPLNGSISISNDKVEGIPKDRLKQDQNKVTAASLSNCLKPPSFDRLYKPMLFLTEAVPNLDSGNNSPQKAAPEKVLSSDVSTVASAATVDNASSSARSLGTTVDSQEPLAAPYGSLESRMIVSSNDNISVEEESLYRQEDMNRMINEVLGDAISFKI